MRIVIVTGVSGAGKTTALKTLEDMGFTCVDNLPVLLIGKFVELLRGDQSRKDTALGIDVRGGEELSRLEGILDEWDAEQVDHQVLFLDASDEVLVRRFKETRRGHPLAPAGRVEDGIRAERQKLAFLKRRADFILDTSTLLTRELGAELSRLFAKDSLYANLFVTIVSFGFKYGIPADADMVFDVRFLPNPYYVEELRGLTGNDRAVQEYVRQGGDAGAFLDKLTDMVEFLLPRYVSEGRHQLVIAIGCTGGKHRSVTVANLLYDRLSAHREIGIKLDHRDAGRRQGA